LAAYVHATVKILIVAGGMTLPEVTEEELAEIYAVSGEADIILAGSAAEAREHWPEAEVALGIIDRESFLRAKNLRWLHSVAAGADMLMFAEMVSSDVLLTGEKGLVGEHLADHAFALLLALTRQLRRAILEAPNSWQSRAAMRKVMTELSGSVMGIVGLGGTGRAVAKRARAFGMTCIAADIEDVERPLEVSELWRMDRFHELLAASDVVTVCCPLTRNTRGLFDDRAFAAMKPGAFLVNVTRGAIIDEGALLRALSEGRIAGAGLDVTPVEPLPPESPLWTLPNVVITPHTAGASQMRARRNVARFIENLRRYRRGEPLEGLIDKQKGY
jgi:phosphoglycerate dehydrogenase-like enzyme